jgi:hypothetical protein
MKLQKRFDHIVYSLDDAKSMKPLRENHAALLNKTTIFPSMVVPSDSKSNILVSGINNRKLGDRILKGRWKGAHIYSLTLVERETCPETCLNWRTCYGNTMPFARRVRPDNMDALQTRLFVSVWDLLHRHDKIAVRLHVLGDFFSEQYIWHWGFMLFQFKNLHVFGFTAHDISSPLGSMIDGLNKKYPEKCSIRFSTDTVGHMNAITVVDKPQQGDQVIVCPAQQGKTDGCGSCALCWSTAFADKTVAFIAHGMKRKVELKGETRRHE